MKKIAALGIVLGSAFLAAPVLAGGPSVAVAEPTVAPVTTTAPAANGEWTGFYAGGQLGYGTTNLPGSDGSGFAYGVNGGYRYDFGQFVAGAEYSYDTTGINAGAGIGLDHSNALKLQAGYDLGQALVYGTVGTERAHFSGGAGSQDGLVAGVGVDYQLSDRMTAGAEVLRHNYGSFDGAGIGVDGTTVAAKVGFRF